MRALRAAHGTSDLQEGHDDLIHDGAVAIVNECNRHQRLQDFSHAAALREQSQVFLPPQPLSSNCITLIICMELQEDFDLIP